MVSTKRLWKIGAKYVTYIHDDRSAMALIYTLVDWDMSSYKGVATSCVGGKMHGHRNDRRTQHVKMFALIRVLFLLSF